jgi:hypothetical protein
MLSCQGDGAERCANSMAGCATVATTLNAVGNVSAAGQVGCVDGYRLMFNTAAACANSSAVLNRLLYHTV